uniref:Uncharacterized protein n=1 Tax=Macrostomum lignano TaxID=282301 RepID=A0A1I8FHU7_9PLAT
MHRSWRPQGRAHCAPSVCCADGTGCAQAVPAGSGKRLWANLV